MSEEVEWVCFKCGDVDVLVNGLCRTCVAKGEVVKNNSVEQDKNPSGEAERPSKPMESAKATQWDGSTVHVESAIKADNPSREENIRTIASRLARFNALESQRDALVAALEAMRERHNTSARASNFPACGCHDCARALAALSLARGETK